MSDTKTKPSPKKDSASTDAPSANPSLQAAFDEANEKGYFGTTPDETPNEAYTVAGVTKAAQKGGK